MNTPINLALAGILIAVVAFWAGGRGSDDSSASAARGFPGASSQPDAAASSGPPGARGGARGLEADGSSTSGEVTSLDGNTLYVSTSDGNTVKVKVDKNTTVTRTAEAKASQIHPGDTVQISGDVNNAGLVKAQSVTATEEGATAQRPTSGGRSGLPSPPGSG